MANTFVLEITVEQERVIDKTLSWDDVQLKLDGTVQATVWSDYKVQCWTIHRDGSRVLEERDLDSDGWQTFSFDYIEELH